MEFGLFAEKMKEVVLCYRGNCNPLMVLPSSDCFDLLGSEIYLFFEVKGTPRRDCCVVLIKGPISWRSVFPWRQMRLLSLSFQHWNHEFHVLYQRVSPDCLPLSNGRKPNLRTCKEDGSDNRRILNYSNGFEGKALRFRPGTAPSTSQEQNFSQFAISHSLQPENHTDAKSPNNHESGPVGDVLLQWGQNKRSRGSRADNRLVTDESSIQARQGAKIHRRVVSRVEKLATAMPPPCTTSPYSRGANLRPCLPVREPTGSLPSRGLEEQSGPGNGPPPSNSRVNSRSTDKWSRSPPSPSKPDKTASSSVTTVKEKPNGSVPQANPMNIESTPQSELEAGATGEKLNFDIFEWPRIYISLSRKEKEDDFLIMKGTKLSQRPKKRAKNVDRALQYCFPGMWLSDLTRGRYEVREKKCVKKKRRGLKGMESMDSDSE